MQAYPYAKALHSLLAEHPRSEEKFLKSFVETVIKNGHEYLFPRIIKSFERIVAKADQSTTIEVVTAQEISNEEVQALLKKEPFKKVIASTHKKVVRKTDDTIIGGTIVRTGTTRVDASYKKSLQKIYLGFTGSL